MFKPLRDKLLSEFQFLRDFALGILRGEVTASQIQQRMNQYANGIWSSFWKGKSTQQENAGASVERRILDPAASHCEDCVGYAAQGWQPIGSLPAPGEDSQCGHNCRCEKEYARLENGQVIPI